MYKKTLLRWRRRSRAPMPSRRWDPGIGVGACLATIWQDYISDSGNQDFFLVTLGRDLGIDKGIIGRLRKLWIGFLWWWIQINSQIESRIYTGYLTDSVILIAFFMEIDPQDFQFGFFGVWLLRSCWDLKLARINLWRYGFMGEYLLTEFMENSNKYNRIVGGALCCIILIVSFIDFKTRSLFLFVLTMYCISRFDSGVFCLSVQISGDGGCTVVFCNFHSLRLRVLALWGQIWVMIP